MGFRIKLIIGFVIVAIFSIFFFIFVGYRKEKTEQAINEKIIKSVNQLASYLNGFDKKPLPKGNLILLNKDLQVIHLKDRSLPLSLIKNLYVIQGTTCFLKDNKDLKKKKILYYDIRFSPKNEKFSKKCFTYSVTVDRKYFQIGAVLKKGDHFVSYITGNSPFNMIKDFESNYIVKNGDEEHLPYMPAYNYQLMLVFEKGFEKRKVKIDLKGCNEKEIGKKEFLIYPATGDDFSDCNINLEGKDFIAKLIYPDGTIQVINPDKSGKAEVNIEEYKFDGEITDSSLVNKLGKIVYSFVKLDDNSSVTLKDQKGNVLIIRGTKFVVDTTRDGKSYVYLDKGGIQVDTRDGKEYILDDNLHLIGFDQFNKLLLIEKFLKKIGDLIGGTVAFDFYNKEKFALKNIKTVNDSFLKQKFKEQPKGAYIFLFKNQNAKLNKVLDIRFSNKNNYHLIVLDGTLLERPDQILPKMKKLTSIRRSFDSLCKMFGYRGEVSKDDFYNFISSVYVKSGLIKFKLNKNLFDLIKFDYPIILKDNIKRGSDLNILYYDSLKETLIRGPISWKDRKNKDGKKVKFKGISVLCY